MGRRDDRSSWSAATPSARAAGADGSRSSRTIRPPDGWDLLTDYGPGHRWPARRRREQPQSPSYLAWHPDGRHVYAVGEVSDGQVWALRIDAAAGTGWRYSARRPPVGRTPATWPSIPSGTGAAHRELHLGQHGRPSDPTGRSHRRARPSWCSTRDPARTRTGSGARTRTWSTFVDDTLVLAVDLGARRDRGVPGPDAGAATPAAAASSSLPAGFGPRHLVAAARRPGGGRRRADRGDRPAAAGPGHRRADLLDVSAARTSPGAGRAQRDRRSPPTDGYVLMANRGTGHRRGLPTAATGRRAAAGSTRFPAVGRIRGTSRWSTTRSMSPTRTATRSPC